MVEGFSQMARVGWVFFSPTVCNNPESLAWEGIAKNVLVAESLQRDRSTLAEVSTGQGLEPPAAPTVPWAFLGSTR